MSKVTRIEDAQALKRMGAPLNTPVEDREFTREGYKRYRRVWHAGDDLWHSALDYHRDNSERRFTKVKASLDKLHRAMLQLDAYIVRLPNDDIDAQVEAAVFAHFLLDNVQPFVIQWHAMLAALEAGEGAPVCLEFPAPEDLWKLQQWPGGIAS